MTDRQRTGVLLMSYGTPAGPDDIEAYYTHIRRGRPPSADQLAELRERYQLIGGHFPLRERTAAQIERIRAALDDEEPGGYLVAQGCKHASPFVEDGVATLAEAAVESVIGVVLSPHRSGAGTDQYHSRAASACAEHNLSYTAVRSWADLPEFIDFQTAALRDTLETIAGSPQVIFTAHSLPERALVGDGYADELHASARRIAEKAGLSRWGEWATGWQSAGQTEMEWAGPDVCDVITDLAETGRSDGIVVVPQGFSSDHLEVLFDLDIAAAQVARDAGITFARTATVNDNPEVMGAIARRIVDEHG